MAEFGEVVRQWRRMCEAHTCADKTTNSVPYETICPITIEHNGYPCDACVVDLTDESIEQVEQIVTRWAKENPEPQYPTWWEWLADKGIVPAEVKASVAYELNKTGLVNPIPADIAENLGLKPKEAE